MIDYIPPFDIAPAMLNFSASISEMIGKLDLYHNFKSKPHLRRSNRIKSIHSSLTIEANSLSLKEVRDIIAGRTVLGPSNEILEVKNAYAAYGELSHFDPYSVDELKRIHGIMTKGLIEESGLFRSSDEGVFDGDRVIFVIFVAPPPTRVPTLIESLFEWVKNEQELNPLIISAVFHYEFVFIHPFANGNGRMARLWQTALLTQWRDVFQFLPIESQIEKDQTGYYRAIAESNARGNLNAFIEFMLHQIHDAFTDLLNQVSEKDGHISEYVAKILSVMKYDEPYTAHQIMEKLHIKSKETFRKNYLNPAMELGLIHMTLPDTPRSKNQRYVRR